MEIRIHSLEEYGWRNSAEENILRKLRERRDGQAIRMS